MSDRRWEEALKCVVNWVCLVYHEARNVIPRSQAERLEFSNLALASF